MLYHPSLDVCDWRHADHFGNVTSANHTKDDYFLGSMHERIIVLLGSEGEKLADMHCRMKMQYRDICMPLQQVYEWPWKFKSAVSNLPGAVHSIQPHIVNRPETNTNDDVGKPMR